jgi:hypothetical protein
MKKKSYSHSKLRNPLKIFNNETKVIKNEVIIDEVEIMPKSFKNFDSK